MTDPGPKGWIWHGEIIESYPEAQLATASLATSQFCAVKLVRPPAKDEGHSCGSTYAGVPKP